MDPTGGRDRTVSSWVWTTFVEYAVQLFRLWPDDRGTRTTRLGDAYVAHAREVHDWPYPEQAIRNYAEATQRLTGGSERPPAIEDFEIHSVTDDRIDDASKRSDYAQRFKPDDGVDPDEVIGSPAS